MPEGQVLVLNVLVEGHFFFEVKLRKEDGVNTLKNLVREQGKSRVFRDVDPAELVLLKVSMFQGQRQRGSLHTLSGQH
jgi:predicted membrane chloride channel (bestrophin family)